ncbi:nucleotidyltransferase domain-containing protein [Shigella flexneri]|uniref:nucleotidyltransferase domain-containing protein n=1 Tax=Bacteria TaxID=2 RepID=UPI00138E4897|nr:nucleotidyltransferase domain-containing protein [Pseudoalteromonas undina]
MKKVRGETLTQIKNILNDLKKYVAVVGSVAEGTSTEYSDIDFYVKSKSEEVIDKEIEANNYSLEGIEDTYIDLIIEVLEKHDIQWESLFVSYITTKNLPIQLEFSSVFNIHDKKESKVSVFGIEFDSYVN